MIPCSSTFCALDHTLTRCKIKQRKTLHTFLVAFAAAKRSSTSHSYPLVAFTFGLSSSHLPSSSRISMWNTVFRQIEVIFLFLTSFILLFCAQFRDFTVHFWTLQTSTKGCLQFLQLKVSLVCWLLLFNHKNGFNSNCSSTPLEHLIPDCDSFQLWTVNRHIKIPFFFFFCTRVDHSVRKLFWLSLYWLGEIWTVPMLHYILYI